MQIQILDPTEISKIGLEEHKIHFRSKYKISSKTNAKSLFPQILEALKGFVHCIRFLKFF